jgi:hypothetical protein
LTGYDSNVLLFPNVSAGSTGVGTLLQSIRLGLLYQSPSSGRFGASYFGSGNLNFNASAKDGQFLIQSLGLSYRLVEWEFDALSLRSDSLFVMRYSTDSGGFGSQSFSSGIGLAWETETTGGTRWSASVSYLPQFFFTDSSLDTYARKTGGELRLRGMYSKDTKSRWWNPAFELSLYSTRTEGTEFRNQGTEFQFSDRIPVNRSMVSRPFVGLGLASFSERPSGARLDIPLQLGSELYWTLSKSWRAVALLSAQYNYSNITDVYAFTRFAGSVALDTKF